MTFYWWLKNLTLIKPIISQAPAAGKACKKHCNITLWNKKNREQNGCGSVSRSLYPIRSRLQMPVINFQNRAFIKDFLSDAGYIYVTLTKSKPTQIEGEWQFLIMRFPNLEAKRQYLSPTLLLQHMSKFMKNPNCMNKEPIKSRIEGPFVMMTNV